MRKPKKGPKRSELDPAKRIDLEAFNREEVKNAIQKAINDAYNWEECQYRAKALGVDDWYFFTIVKSSRRNQRQSIPLRDLKNQNFFYKLPPSALQILHEVDQHLAGTLASPDRFLDTEEQRKLYLLRSLREEAIHSSMIEGAVTTREIANEMLRTNRKPRDESEQMVLNNYRTIRMLNERKNEPLTPELLCEVQRELTEGTLKNPEAAGRFRLASEDIMVMDNETNEPLHIPPPAEQLKARVDALCQFANEKNDTSDGGQFLHPAVRAIILHFWLAYDHPFVDGNGRTARALFYWSMLRSGYWLTEYLTISTVISGHPKTYAKAFLDTEIDENDLTYFIVYHLNVIDRSLRDFRDYVERKTAEQKELQQLLGEPFNARQRTLLGRALRDRLAIFTYESHANSYGITINTARADILDLERHKLLVGNRKGRAFEFTPAPDIEARLRKLTKRK